jgi:hypothetical protein
MSKFRSRWRSIVASFFVLCCISGGQVLRARAQMAYPEEEVDVQNLPSLTAQSTHSADVLRTSLEIVVHDHDICCGRNSALTDSLDYANPKSLKDVAAKLEGRHLLSDGRPIMVTTEFMTPDEVNSGHLIYMLLNQHAPLMMWNSHLYVVSGVTYVESVDYSSGVMTNTIHKFLLQDTRYSDERREGSYDRTTEDASKVQGLLFLDWKPQ